MKIVNKTSVRFRGEGVFGESHELIIRHTNRGEPYLEGIEVDLNSSTRHVSTTLFLEEGEAREIRDLLNRLYPPK